MACASGDQSCVVQAWYHNEASLRHGIQSEIWYRRIICLIGRLSQLLKPLCQSRGKTWISLRIEFPFFVVSYCLHKESIYTDDLSRWQRSWMCDPMNDMSFKYISDMVQAEERPMLNTKSSRCDARCPGMKSPNLGQTPFSQSYSHRSAGHGESGDGGNFEGTRGD